MISMTVLLYVGLHLNKPFPWEKKDDEQCLTILAILLYTMYIMTKQDKIKELKLKQLELELDVRCLQSQIRSEKERLEEMKTETSLGEDWSSSVCILRTQKDLKTAEKQLIRKQNKLTKFLKETI